MTNPFPLFRVLLCILLLPLLMDACNPKPATSDKTGTSLATEAGSTIPTIYMDSLMLSDSIFLLDEAKARNIIFSYFLTDTTVTLHGWLLKKVTPDTGQFTPKPNLILKPVGKTTTALGPNTYLGSQVMLRKQVLGIRKILKDKNQPATLYFTPQKDTANRIYYNIIIRFRDGSSRLLAVPLSTNPSPPHQAFGL